MQANTITLLGVAIIQFTFIALISRFDKKWLFGSIFANLLLIAIFGSKTIVGLLGYLTNSGNVMYAAVVFAVYLIIERHGKDAALRTIWASATFMVFFLLMSEILVNILGTPATREADQALRSIFENIPRIGIASTIAFVISQHAGIYLYDMLRTRNDGAKLWLRNGIGVMVVQIIDSILFFSLAFFGFLPNNILFEIILSGLLAKILLGFISTPFLYLSLRLK